MPAQSTLNRLRVAISKLIRSAKPLVRARATRAQREELKAAITSAEATLLTKRGQRGPGKKKMAAGGQPA